MSSELLPLFAIVMDNLIDEACQEFTWIWMIADDIMIWSQRRDQVELAQVESLETEHQTNQTLNVLKNGVVTIQGFYITAILQHLYPTAMFPGHL